MLSNELTFETYSRRTFFCKESSTFLKTQKERADLLEVEAMGDVVSSHEGSQQMGDGPGLSTVRPEQEGVHASLSGKQKVHRFDVMVWRGEQKLRTHTQTIKTYLRSWFSTAMLAYM